MTRRLRDRLVYFTHRRILQEFRAARRRGALWLCMLAGSATAQAQYRFDAWTTDNGLPQNSVYSILQTRDGYLWFTTLDGLVRYNGAQFTVFNHANTKGLADQRFKSLYEDRDGNLWISSEENVLTRYRDGRFTVFTTEQGLPDNQVRWLGRTVDGALLARTQKGLARFQNERFEAVASDPLGFDSEIGYRGHSGMADVTGAVWYRRGTELRRVSNGRMTVYQVPNGASNQLYEDRQGRLWIGSSRKGELAMLEGAALRIYSARDGLPLATFDSFCEDRAGALWFGTDNGGLVRFKDGKFTTFATEHGLSSNRIRVIFEDREGIIWIGASDNGLMRMTPQLITTYSEKDGLVEKTFYPIIEDRAGDVWIANIGANRFRDGKFSHYPLKPPAPNPPEPFSVVRSMCEDNAGRLLLSGVGHGLAVIQNGKVSYEWTGMAQAPLAMYQDRKGAFWFGFNGKLLREKDGVRHWFDAKDGLQGIAQPIYEDRQGRLWIGTYGGLAQYIDGRLRFYTERDGLSSNRIRAIYEDGEGVLWTGTYDGGLPPTATACGTKPALRSPSLFILRSGRRIGSSRWSSYRA